MGTSGARLWAASVAFVLAPPSIGSARGLEGYHMIAILAKHYMAPDTRPRMQEVLSSESSGETAG